MAAASRRPRILVVDDDAPVRELIRSLLDEHGFDVAAEAANGSEAIELAAQVTLDAITMDIEMPVLDGVAATQAICTEGCVPVVIVSGSQSSEDVGRALAAGARWHVAKRDLSDQLVPVLRSLLLAPAPARN